MRSDKDVYLSLGLGSLLLNSGATLSIKKLEKNNDFAYVLNKSIGILFKYSTVRTSPWSFNFNLTDKLVINEFEMNYSNYFVGLVCGINCVGVLNEEEVFKLIDIKNVDNSRITLRTFSGGSLSVSGSLGKLPYKISKTNAWQGLKLGKI